MGLGVLLIGITCARDADMRSLSLRIFWVGLGFRADSDLKPGTSGLSTGESRGRERELLVFSYAVRIKRSPADHRPNTSVQEVPRGASGASPHSSGSLPGSWLCRSIDCDFV